MDTFTSKEKRRHCDQRKNGSVNGLFYVHETQRCWDCTAGLGAKIASTVSKKTDILLPEKSGLKTGKSDISGDKSNEWGWTDKHFIWWSSHRVIACRRCFHTRSIETRWDYCEGGYCLHLRVWQWTFVIVPVPAVKAQNTWRSGPEMGHGVPGRTSDPTSLSYIGVTKKERVYGWKWIRANNKTKRIADAWERIVLFNVTFTEGCDTPFSVHRHEAVWLVLPKHAILWSDKRDSISLRWMLKPVKWRHWSMSVVFNGDVLWLGSNCGPIEGHLWTVK